MPECNHHRAGSEAQHYTAQRGEAPAPLVSFVVPCYKLGHLLRQCVQSILSQSFQNLEILIMDDCSPDDTAAVATSFGDDRVCHIRNPENLGALRNYNHGIGLARGRYIWLISADDYLRVPDLVERYVGVMEANPKIGFAFCAGVGVRDSMETQVLDFSQVGSIDRIFRGDEFLQYLLARNVVLAPSAMARRECYETVSNFPLDARWAGKPVDMIWGGDWYLWLAFSIHHDVAYFADAMVCYREHELSMSNAITQRRTDEVWRAELFVVHATMLRARAAGYSALVPMFLRAIANHAAHHAFAKEYRWLQQRSVSTVAMTDILEALDCEVPDPNETRFIRTVMFEQIGDLHESRGDLGAARQWYLRSLGLQASNWKIYWKIALTILGRTGGRMRATLRSATSD